jgi:hypothetical protein
METAIAQAHHNVEREALIRAQIDLLESIGDRPRLTQLLHRLAGTEPATTTRAMLAWLALGEFELVCEQTECLHALSPTAALCILPLHIVALVLSGRIAAAEPLIRQFQLHARADDHQRMAEVWMRGIHGHLLAEQRSAITSAVDPSDHQLHPLLVQALETFDALLATPSESPASHAADAQDDADLRRHRASCLALLGAASGVRDAPGEIQSGLPA